MVETIFNIIVILRSGPIVTFCTIPLDCLVTPLPRPPSWDPLNSFETRSRSFWALSPRPSWAAAPRRVWIEGLQKRIERVSRQFRGSQEELLH